MKKKKYNFVLLAILIITATLVSLLLTQDQIIESRSKKSPFKEISGLYDVKIPILMYHYVEINKDKNDYLRDRQNVPPNIFEQQIVTLKNAGYKFITPNELDTLLSISFYDKYVIISFDDGYEDFYTDAYPIIKRQKIKAINYIIFNFINQNNYMSTAMVKEISKDKNIEIGSHTLTHKSLTSITRDLAYSEILESKKHLEQTFNIKVESFAFPYGYFNEDIIKLVKKAGYTNAVTVDQGNLVSANGIFRLKRLRPGHLVGKDLINYIEKDF